MPQERLEEIRASRLKKRAQILASGVPPYPAEAKRSHTVEEALADFDNLKEAETPVMLVGRVGAIRRHGGVIFMDVKDETGTLQWQATTEDCLTEAWKNFDQLDVGDFVQGAGQLGMSKREMQTFLVKDWHCLSKSIRPLPSTWYGLKDREQRYREREVDFLLNDPARAVIKTRSQLLTALRQRLTNDGFLEVETPILQTQAGGATAEPFVTHHNALNQDLYLRIAPELYLKRLIVGGFEKVFEIGRNFRNEGMDREHNPEFTMLEFYWAYADYEDLMSYMELLLPSLVKAVTGGTAVTRGEGVLEFAAPWQRLNYIETMSDRLGCDILAEKDPDFYVGKLTEHGLAIPAGRNYAKLVDELFKELVRPGIIQPTIVYDYPTELVPLAKQKAQDARVAEMFQVLINGAEIAKAYSEQNDPVIQREKFEEQKQAKLAGDKEAGDVDEDYLRAMEYGMPPVAGLGMGIDRLLWLLTNNDNLRDTIAFPTLKTTND